MWPDDYRYTHATPHACLHLRICSRFFPNLHVSAIQSVSTAYRIFRVNCTHGDRQSNDGRDATPCWPDTRVARYKWMTFLWVVWHTDRQKNRTAENIRKVAHFRGRNVFDDITVYRIGLWSFWSWMFYGFAIWVNWRNGTDGQTDRQDATSKAASNGRAHNKSPIMII